MTGAKSLRVAVVGLGYFSRFHLASWQAIERTCLVGVTDIDDQRARRTAELYRTGVFPHLDALLERTQPDLLDIVTPPSSHAEVIRAAIGRVGTIICQKPFCQSAGEAKAVARAAREAGCTLIVHENFRFQPWYRAIKQLLNDDRIGRVYQAHFRLRPGDGQGDDAYLERQPSFQKMQRFLLHETGVHFVDLFRWMFGDVDAVYCDLRRLNPAIAGEDAGVLILEHRNGIRSIFDGNRLSDHIAENRRQTMGEMIIEGEAGTIRLDGQGRVFLREHGSNIEASCPVDTGYEGFGGGCVEALNRHVVEHILDDAPIENDAESYLPVVALDEAAYRSNEQGMRIVMGDGKHV